MHTYILAHDVGTSGNKAVLYDENGALCASALAEYKTWYPAAGWAEQDSADWWRAVCLSTRELLEKTGIPAHCIGAVCFSGQMMGCLALDESGNPIRKAIIWADNRSAEQALQLGAAMDETQFFHITGARPSASYVASKLMWIREQEPEVFAHTAKIMQAKDYIAYRLTGNMATDYSDASGSNLFDIRRKCWSEDLLYAAKLPRRLLPDAVPSTACVGRVTREAAEAVGLLAGTPVIIGGGDGACASVGAGAWRDGSLYCSAGSSAWASMTVREPIYDSGRQIFNIVHMDETLYAPCCSMQSAGASLSWLRSMLFGGADVSYDAMCAEASVSPSGANGLLFLPYLMGERCPRWNPIAEGIFAGLTLSTTRADLIRAVMEGVGFNLRALLDIFHEQKHTPDTMILVSGCAKSALWLQIIADICMKSAAVPANTGEATSIGAAICGGVGVGIFESFAVCEAFNATARRVEPIAANSAVYEAMYALFHRAYDQMEPLYPLLDRIKRKNL